MVDNAFQKMIGSNKIRCVGEYVRCVGISDIFSEVELILACASTFSFPSKISTWTVCPAHRSSLRIRWRRGANRCRIPAWLAKHTIACEQALWGTGAGAFVEGKAARMALNFECRVQILDAKY